MDKAEAQKQIDLLTRELKEHNYRYYVLDEPVISDLEFDRKLKELEHLEQLFPDLAHPDSPTRAVGGAPANEFETVKHRRPMFSLGNTYNEQELRDFDARVRKVTGDAVEYVCELKIDGLAISLFYEQGRLVQAVTRGDGVQGDDVTTNVRTIRSLAQTLHGTYPDSFEIRGEIFMHRKGFERLNREREAAGEAPYANPRNVASGSLKIKDPAEVANRPLDITLYHLLADQLPYRTHFECIQAAKSWGLKTADTTRVCRGVDEVLAYLHEWDQQRHNLGFDTDGVVIKVNDLNMQLELGYTAKVPRWAIAYKYQTESALTTLLGITYQVGRTGAITPVAELQPVFLLGTTVKRASLHNANEIERLDVRVGDMVFIEKGGEIIPKITGVDFSQRKSDSQPTTYITHCPECGTTLVRNEGEAQHYCPNEEKCPPQIVGRILHFVDKKAMDIDGLGEEIIKILFENKKIQNYADLYDIAPIEIIGLTKWINKEYSGIKYQGQLQVALSRAIFGLSQQWGKLTLKDSQELSNQITTLEEISTLSDNSPILKNSKIRVFIHNYIKASTKIDKSKYHSLTQHVSLDYLIDLQFPHIYNNLSQQTLFNIFNNINYIDELLHVEKDKLFINFIEKIKDREKNTIQEKTAIGICDSIKLSKQKPYEKVLFALGIKGIGEVTARNIAKHFTTIDSLINATVDNISAVDDIGKTTAESVKLYFSKPENILIINKLRNHGLNFQHKEIEGSTSKLIGKSFIVSGTFSTSREELIRIIETNGGKSVSSISKSTNYLIFGDKPGNSKMEFAKKHNITIISETDFYGMLS